MYLPLSTDVFSDDGSYLIGTKRSACTNVPLSLRKHLNTNPNNRQELVELMKINEISFEKKAKTKYAWPLYLYRHVNYGRTLSSCHYLPGSSIFVSPEFRPTVPYPS